jgi:hypothetical protein
VPSAAPLRPFVNPTANQQTADTIAERLRQSGQLRQYHVDVVFKEGTAELRGSVTDEAQRQEALRLVQGVPGVACIRDRLVLAGYIQQVQDVQVPSLDAPAQTPPPPAPQTAPPAPGATPPAPATEPMPIYQAVPPSPYDLNPPKMPPYAWPTYAPYNNYGRVAYPTLYPYNSFPFIGPNYPFPKIPLNWRSVELTWYDGYWWYGPHSTSHDWWRLRYW